MPFLAATVTLVLWSVHAQPAFAAINVSGDYAPEDPQSWSRSDSIYVGRTGAGSLAIDDGSQLYSSNGYLGQLPGAQGAATITGADSKWENGWLFVGDDGDGTLDVSSGGLVVSGAGAYIATDTGSTSLATIAGAGSRWEIETFFRIGDRGAGELNVVAGGQVVNGFGSSLGVHPGATGSAIVTGAGSEWDAGRGIDVGEEGSGTLLVEAGGRLLSGPGYIARMPGSSGDVRVSGVGASWTIMVRSTLTDPISVGRAGRGTLTIDSGGEVSSRASYIGENAGSNGVATITGTGSVWNCRYAMSVGVGGDGDLLIEAGGHVNSRSGSLGYFFSGDGTATVTGVGSQWNTDRGLDVGVEGSGVLEISNGGLVSVGTLLTIGRSVRGDRRIDLSTGGMLALRGRMDGSLDQFLGVINGSNAMRYWDESLADWAPLATATAGRDYTLDYLTAGDLAGYTLLTVGDVPAPVPAPGGVALLAWGFAVGGMGRLGRPARGGPGGPR